MTVRPDRSGSGSSGPGLVAAVHATALSRIPGARVAAVLGSQPGSERAARLAADHGAHPAADLDGLLADPEVDAVTICTPHPLHAAPGDRRRGGRPSMSSSRSRWPSTAAEAAAMIDAADRAGVVLSVISQRRWYPPARRVKAAIDAGRIGRPALGIVEVLGWRGPEYYAMDAWRGTLAGEGGGVLVNQAVHQLDLACWFLGEAVEVDGWTANVNHPEIEVEDTAVAIVRFASGALGDDRREQQPAAGPPCPRPRPRHERGVRRGGDRPRLDLRRRGHAAEPAAERPVDDPGRGGRTDPLGGRGRGGGGRPSTWPPSSTRSSCATSSRPSATAGRRRSPVATAWRPWR